MVRKSAVMLLYLGLMHPSVVSALGLGELTVKSYLNEPLRADVDLIEVGGLNAGQVKIRLASREDFERANVERAYFLTSLSFDIELQSRDRGILHISSKLPVHEPFLDFLVEVRWPNGRLLREYTVLLDLPVFSGAASQPGVNSAIAPGSDNAVAVEPVRPSGDPDATVFAEQVAEQGGRSHQAASRGAPLEGEHLVRQNETLWSIATRARPQGSTVQQTMLDIHRLNPSAFMDNNINRLKAGYLLQLPSAGTRPIMDQASAEATVAEQVRNWQREKGAETAIDTRMIDRSAANEDASTSQDSGQGRLRIAGGEEANSSGGTANVAASLEKLDQTERENADLEARLLAIEERLQTTQRLMALKDDRIASLQAALTQTNESESEGEVLVGSVSAADNLGSDSQNPGTASGSAQAGGEEAAADDQQSGQMASAPDKPIAAGSTPEQQTVTKNTPANAGSDASPAWWEGKLMMLSAGALLVILALVYAVRSRRNPVEHTADISPATGVEKRQVEDAFAGVELADDDLVVDEITGAGSEDPATQIITEPLAAEDDIELEFDAELEGGDALAEADIYIAYGRYPQALELLRAAIVSNPRNPEYRLKLLELSVEMHDKEEFQRNYSDLLSIGDENTIRRAQGFLSGVDGGALWIESLPLSTLPVEALNDASETIETDDDFVLDEDVALLDEDYELELEEDVFVDPEFESGNDLIAIDLELEAETADLAATKAEIVEDEAPTRIQAPAQQDPLAELGAFDMDNFELDDDILDSETEEEAIDSEIPELDLDIFDVDDELDTDINEAPNGSEQELLTEFGELEIEAGTESEGSDTELVFAADGDEVSTKLDLARAYMDMGDEDGANNILQEVIQDGSQAQQQEARDLLANIR